MSTNKTEHYQLHAWELGDNFLLSEINENFAAVDTALGGKAEVVMGTCTGDGEERQFIDLGFTPKAVLLVAPNGHMNAGYEAYGGLALPEYPVNHTAGVVLIVAEGGFYIRRETGRTYHVVANNSSCVSHFLAFR